MFFRFRLSVLAHEDGGARVRWDAARGLGEQPPLLALGAEQQWRYVALRKLQTLSSPAAEISLR